MSRELKPWTDEEFGFLTDHPEMSSREIAEALGRTKRSVAGQRHRINHGIYTDVDRWSTDDDDFIVATPNLTVAQVAKHLGRSHAAVANRRQKIRVARGIDFGGWDKHPERVGPRPLIAKSCLKCGRLLQAKWYTFNPSKGGYWTSRCRRCQPVQKKKQQYPSPDFRLKMKKMTEPTATRSREPYVTEDFKVLGDPTLTILEKALTINRTYNATLIACNRNGYPSHKGLGDPDRDQWYIDNPNLKETA